MLPPRSGGLPKGIALPSSPTFFVDGASQAGLLSMEQIAELKAGAGAHSQPRELAKESLRRGWLTPYQVNQLLQGNGQELVLGNYVLLERLGEGGMGAVFKARNRKLNQIVAIKVIRKVRLGNTSLARRFGREVQAIMRLNHPNIIRALDADQVGGTHFLVMEYVQGIDLAKQVREHGPLPVAQACEFIRQAALGLEHVQANGLVHRDIKPSNLLVTSKGGIVKILDLGLARTLQGEEGAQMSTLTQEGSVLGTPEFLAPEQARNAVSADIRSDLYSLGCTFYFLLTGQVPFPGGTLTEKLIRHQMDVPQGVEVLRPQAAPSVARVITKLMAKKPEDRYQTPIQLAAELSDMLRQGHLESKGQGSSVFWHVARAEHSTEVGKETVGVAPSRRWLMIAIAGGSLLAGLLLLGFLLHGRGSSSRQQGKPAATSPMDKLDAKAIPPGLVSPGQPKELVAILGNESKRTLIYSVAISPDGRLVAGSGNAGTIWLWDVSRPNDPTLLQGHMGPVMTIAFSPDGKWLASGGSDRTAKIWDLASQTAKFTLAAGSQPVRSVAFSPDGKTLATAALNDNILYFWDVATGNRVGGVTKSRNGAFTPLAFAPQGNTLVAGAVFQQTPAGILTIDPRTPPRGTLVYNFMVYQDAPNSKVMQARMYSSGHRGELTGISFSPNGKTLASASMDGTVKLWDPATLMERGSLAVNKAIYSIAFSPDSRWIVTGDMTGRVVCFDVSSRQIVKEWTLPGYVYSVAFAPDNRHIAVAKNDGLVYILRMPQ